MHVKKPLAKPANVIYVYDGSLSGLLCCVHESVYLHEIPVAIESEHESQPSIITQKYIATDVQKAQRVKKSIPLKISPPALSLVENVFLTNAPEKELMILNFLLFAYREGKEAMYMISNENVDPLLKAQRHLLSEAHLLTGFIRFSDYGKGLGAVITPKNFVLPLLAPHFINRFRNENFIIFDKCHNAALIYSNKKYNIVPVNELSFPDVPETESNYRALWKQFYSTIAIESRYNPKCRMTHLPKRYWQNMTEMIDFL